MFTQLTFDLLVWDASLSCRPNTQIHHGSNSNRILTLNEVFPSTVIGAESVFECNCEGEERSGLLKSGREILSILMSVYGEQSFSYLCLKVKLEKKQDNNGVQWFPDLWHANLYVRIRRSTHAHAQKSQLQPTPSSEMKKA